MLSSEYGNNDKLQNTSSKIPPPAHRKQSQNVLRSYKAHDEFEKMDQSLNLVPVRKISSKFEKDTS